MDGYSFSLGPVTYTAHADGTSLTLVDCLRAVYGVGEAVIYRPDGSTVLTNAGALSVRADLRRHFQRRPPRVNMRPAYSQTGA